MPHLNFPVVADGLMLNVLIGIDARKSRSHLRAGRNIPAPINVQAVIDTGSAVTAASGWIFQTLGLTRTRVVTTITAGGQVQTSVYEVSLSIADPSGRSGLLMVRPKVLVTELQHVPANIDLLVGMDVLSEGLLILDGPNRQFTLAF